MSTLAKMVKKLDEALLEAYDEYTELHKEFQQYCGRDIKEWELETINNLLNELQNKFSEIFHVLNFIGHRTQFAANAVNDYNDFIARIEKAGAVTNPQARA